VQDADKGEQSPRSCLVRPQLAFEPLKQHARALIVDAAASHIDGFNLRWRELFDRVEVSLTNLEIVFDDLSERRQRQVELGYRITPLGRRIEDKTPIGNPKF